MNDITYLSGIVLGSFFTIAILSYLLLDDNLFFRLGAYCLVGVSAGYLMAVMTSSVLFEQYLSPLFYNFSLDKIPLLLLLMVLGLLLLARLDPRGSGMAFIPMAFLVGVGAAVVVGGSLTGTFIPQAFAATEPSLFPTMTSDSFTWLMSMLENWFVLLGTLSTLAYFHFGAKPKGGAEPARPALIAPIAHLGKGFLALTLGALYAGALLSSLVILVDRIYFLVQTIVGGG
jgi:hypothetical protein